MDAIVLAGGLGTRLAQKVPNLPKALAPIQGMPFLRILLSQLAHSGVVSNIVLALGYKSLDINDFVESMPPLGVPVRYSVESTPLGTGGAVLNALSHTASDPLLILNGDTFFDLPLSDYLQFHQGHGEALTIACRWCADCSRYGTVKLDGSNRILAFAEKNQACKEGWISGGIYLAKRSLFAPYPPGVYSIENDFFPQFLKQGAFGYPHKGEFIDIGTPTSYDDAQTILKPWISTV